MGVAVGVRRTPLRMGVAAGVRRTPLRMGVAAGGGTPSAAWATRVGE
jgi:hypothetical protein